MKKFSVSIFVEAFATFEIECESEEEARKAALESGPREVEIQQYTIKPVSIETVTEQEPA